MNTPLSMTFHSGARKWIDLEASIKDALFDAQHQHAALQGAAPRLQVFLSRSLLQFEMPDQRKALNRLCAQLQRQGVPYSFHCVALGAYEPSGHRVSITFKE
jgi:hypothetical protein